MINVEDAPSVKIKNRFRQAFVGFWLNPGEEDEPFPLIMDLGGVSLMWNPNTNLIIDVYNNKFKPYVPVNKFRIFVEAKNVKYADEFNIHGEYEIKGAFSTHPRTLLRLEEINTGRVVSMLPSRLRVTDITWKE